MFFFSEVTWDSKLIFCALQNNKVFPHSFIYARLADCKSHSVHDTQKKLLLWLLRYSPDSTQAVFKKLAYSETARLTWKDPCGLRSDYGPLVARWWGWYLHTFMGYTSLQFALQLSYSSSDRRYVALWYSLVPRLSMGEPGTHWSHVVSCHNVSQCVIVIFWIVYIVCW